MPETTTLTTTPPTVTATLATTEKPGWKTSEFWLKLLAYLLTALYATDAIPTGSAIGKVAAIAATMLGAIGYTVVRGRVKVANANSVAMVAQAANDNARLDVMRQMQAQAGFMSLGLVMFVAIFGVIVIGCAWFRSESKAVAGDVVDCTGSTAQAHIKEYGPLADAALVYMTGGDGHIDKAAVKSSAINMAIESGGCVLADAIARALRPAPSDPNAPKTSPLVADPADLRATLAELYPGLHFKTPNGLL